MFCPEDSVVTIEPSTAPGRTVWAKVAMSLSQWIKRTGSSDWREIGTFYGFISPLLVGWAIFLIGPLLYSLYLSLTNYDVLNAPVFVGAQNYLDLLSDTRFHKALYNTAYFVVFYVPISTGMALGLALLLHAVRRGKALFRAIFYVPAIVPVVPATLVFIWLLNFRYGLINSALKGLGMMPQAWLTEPDLLKPSLIFLTLWGFGTSMLVFLAGLQAIPKDYYEAASMDGASPWRQFQSITLPLLSPTTLFVFITKLIGAFQIFSSVYVLSGGTTVGGPQDAALFVVPYLYNLGFKLGRFGYASAVAWVLTLIIMALTLLSMRLTERYVYYETTAEGRD